MAPNGQGTVWNLLKYQDFNHIVINVNPQKINVFREKQREKRKKKEGKKKERKKKEKRKKKEGKKKEKRRKKERRERERVTWNNNRCNSPIENFNRDPLTGNVTG